MVAWTMNLYPINGAVRLTNAKFTNMSISWNLNGPGSLEVEVPLRHAQATTSNYVIGNTEMRVFADGNEVWAGYLWGVDVDVANDSLRFFGEGYLSMLRHRVVVDDLLYVGVAAHQIAWNLINYTQGQPQGALGFTQGSHAGGSLTVTEEYCAADFPNIGDAINDIATQDDTFDFCITPTITINTDKVFRTFNNPRMGTDKSASVSINATHTHELTYQLDGHFIANDVRITGGDDCVPPGIAKNHAGSMAAYGHMYYVEDVNNLTHYRDLEHYANEQLRIHNQPRWSMTLNVDATKAGWAFGAFDIGDIIAVVGGRGYATFASTKFRVISFGADITPAGTSAGASFYNVGLDSVVV